MHEKLVIVPRKKSTVKKILNVDALADAIYGLLTYPALGRMFASKGLEEVTGLKWTNAAAKIKTVYETVVAEANN